MRKARECRRGTGPQGTHDSHLAELDERPLRGKLRSPSELGVRSCNTGGEVLNLNGCSQWRYVSKEWGWGPPLRLPRWAFPEGIQRHYLEQERPTSKHKERNKSMGGCRQGGIATAPTGEPQQSHGRRRGRPARIAAAVLQAGLGREYRNGSCHDRHCGRRPRKPAEVAQQRHSLLPPLQLQSGSRARAGSACSTNDKALSTEPCITRSRCTACHQ